MAGARPRRELLTGPESLTPSERRVAEAAAAGATNREVATQLFLSPKTVEMHLGRVYRKLEISSRGELAGALGHAARWRRSAAAADPAGRRRRPCCPARALVERDRGEASVDHLERGGRASASAQAAATPSRRTGEASPPRPRGHHQAGRRARTASARRGPRRRSSSSATHAAARSRPRQPGRLGLRARATDSRRRGGPRRAGPGTTRGRRACGGEPAHEAASWARIAAWIESAIAGSSCMSCSRWAGESASSRSGVGGAHRRRAARTRSRRPSRAPRARRRSRRPPARATSHAVALDDGRALEHEEEVPRGSPSGGSPPRPPAPAARAPSGRRDRGRLWSRQLEQRDPLELAPIRRRTRRASRRRRSAARDAGAAARPGIGDGLAASEEVERALDVLGSARVIHRAEPDRVAAAQLRGRHEAVSARLERGHQTLVERRHLVLARRPRRRAGGSR